ncbi:MAG: hypothetical protein HC894_06750 [Microcoleus sp. SM1_3_4]|nr:hypothetical protein [Microcoleus sp. SM1_3_4]
MFFIIYSPECLASTMIFPSNKDRPSTINYQLSTVNCQLSTVNCQLSTVNYQLSTINFLS